MTQHISKNNFGFSRYDEDPSQWSATRTTNTKEKFNLELLVFKQKCGAARGQKNMLAYKEVFVLC